MGNPSPPPEVRLATSEIDLGNVGRVEDSEA